MSLRLARTGLLALAVSATAMGCAEERDPINRVQANALSKSFFVGEDLVNDVDNPKFYANGTLLDVGYGAAQSGLFTAFYSNDLSIIRWEITEDYLIGRLGFERIEGTDGKGAGQETNDGQVLYAFRIDSHFDIRRSYNPSTGEELNVIEENTADRPWYEREYMRVDWSKNMVTDAYDYDTSALYGLFFGVEYQELGYYVSDPQHEHAPRFEPSEGYFDITTKAYAQPGMVDLSHLGWGLDSIPACFLDADFSGGTAPAANCNPHEITIRHSFWKAPDRDYEPQDWDGYRFQSAGAFTKERKGFARDYGMTDDSWRRFISRYNIWDRSHYYDDPVNMTGAVRCYLPQGEADTGRGEVGTPPQGDPKRDEDNNGTHDECERVTELTGVPGSRCDIYKQKCTLPTRERDVRPIVMYFTNDSDYRFYDSTNWGAQEWDVAMKLAVTTGRHAECLRTGGDIGTCDAENPVPHGQMTMMKDLIDIEREVDTCRWDRGGLNVAPSECADVVDRELNERGYESGTVDYTGMRDVALMDDSVVLCHSPIQADDHPLCAPGKERLPAGITSAMCQESDTNPAMAEACAGAYTIRIGDVRHHLVNVVKSPESPSPWGFGPTYADPLTGEAISASINVWTWPTDFISRSVVDINRFIAGELSVADVTDGTFVKNWARAAELANKGTGALPRLTAEERNHHLMEGFKAIGRSLESGVSKDAHLPNTEANPEVAAQVQKVAAKVKKTRAQYTNESAFRQTYINRMRRAEGSDTEAALTTAPMTQLITNGRQDVPLPAEMLSDMASPLRGMVNPTLQRDLKHMREIGLANRGACMLNADDFAPSPTAMLGLSRIMQEKFGAFNAEDPVDVQLARADRMKSYLAQKMHYAVMIHEMGHTFGYRHNFVSSSGAFNYRPQYWQLRTRNGQIGDNLDPNVEGAIIPLTSCATDGDCASGSCDTNRGQCTNPDVYDVSEVCRDLANSEEEAANCVGPRYYDPLTQEEQDGLIHMWAHSSVMDYAGDYSQDFLGLGAWDFHAARMFYGDVATVFEAPEFNEGTTRSNALVDTILDSFGGIVGYIYQHNGGEGRGFGDTIHYSQLHGVFDLINNCRPIDIEALRPSNWNEEAWGAWHPVLDGLTVSVDGQYTRCDQQRVDYVNWDELRYQGTVEGTPASTQPTGRTGPSIDPLNRTRVPYGFATDRWADLGNLAVYRHDSGADPYELFEFFITEQELRHIFDNYRRNRHTFSVRSASSRVLGRYNTKMRDAAKGLGLIANNIRNLSIGVGLESTSWFRYLLDGWGWSDVMLASGFAFDHYARQLARPQVGIHVDTREPGDPLSVTLEFEENPNPQFDNIAIAVPDGPQGYWNSVGIGGKLVNNDLADDQGEYDAYFTMNAGSYYDKIYTSMLFTESVDNFISSSLDDFVDPRYRAVSIADLFPDGYRRWLANNLTNDDWIKAPRVAASGTGRPEADEELYPTQPIGWTSWWTETPEVCFPGNGTMVCSGYGFDGTTLEPNAPAFTRPLDPQVGWEQQKFLMAWTLVYLPENQKQKWLDLMGIWELGADNDPGFANRIELHVPTGETYIAKTYGTEEICFEECQTVQRGIAARILEYANMLLEQAYVTTSVTQNGATWYIPVLSPDGAPIVKYDPSLLVINEEGQAGSIPGCANDPDPNDNDYSAFDNCECEQNTACMLFEDYISVPAFMRGAMRDFGMAAPSMKGIY